MSDAQIWFVLVTGAVLALMAIITFADAIKGHPPVAPPAPVKTSSVQVDAPDPFSMRWPGTPEE